MIARCRSFRHAANGFYLLCREQHNVRIHMVLAVLVVALAVYLRVSSSEWLFLIIAIGWVLSIEALNTAIEYLGDAVSLDAHPLLGKAKDVAAGAVLISAIGAALIGLLIFLPYLYAFGV